VLVERWGVAGECVVGQARRGVDLPPISREFLDALVGGFEEGELAECLAAQQLGLEEPRVASTREGPRAASSASPGLVPPHPVTAAWKMLDYVVPFIALSSDANLPSGAGEAKGSGS
jgi:hypothetical protein